MAESKWTGRIAFRPADARDLDYCASLYFANMAETMPELISDITHQEERFRSRWEVAQVRIIQRDGDDVGWLQARNEDGAYFLEQFFVDAPFRGQGIGTEVMHRLIGETLAERRAITLGVVKTNPALRLYARLGFRHTHEDDRKVYMRRESE